MSELVIAALYGAFAGAVYGGAGYLKSEAKKPEQFVWGKFLYTVIVSAISSFLLAVSGSQAEPTTIAAAGVGIAEFSKHIGQIVVRRIG